MKEVFILGVLLTKGACFVITHNFSPLPKTEGSGENSKPHRVTLNLIDSDKKKLKKTDAVWRYLSQP